MNPQSRPFVIVYQPECQGPSQRLGSCPDANAATVTAHEALDRLRKQGRRGEVRVVRGEPEKTVVLRLPLVARPTRNAAALRVRPSATSSATAHTGWTTGPR